MLAEWTIFTQVSGVQRCPRSSRQVAADDLRPVHAIVVAGRAARPLQRAHPLRALLLPRADERAVVDVVQRRHVERVEDRVPLLKSVDCSPQTRELTLRTLRARPKAAQAIFGRVRRARLAGRRAQLD